MVPQSTESWLPEGIRALRDAFSRDLRNSSKTGICEANGSPTMATSNGVALDDEPLIRECISRGLNADEYIVDIIEPKPTDPEEVDFPSSWR